MVIILASALAVLLVIAIVAGIMVIRLLKTLRMVADKAEHLVDSAEAVGDMVRQTVSGLSFMKFVHNIVDMVQHKSNKEKK